MAQLYSTGPCALFVGLGTGYAPVFLGHGNRAPDISVQPRYKGVQCDLGGEVDFDTLMVGESGRVSVTLVRYNEAIAAACEAKATAGITAAGGPAGVRGFSGFGEIGTLMLTEGASYPLWILFPFAGKIPVYATMPAGYRFISTFLQSDDVQTGTTQPKMMRFTWTCLRSFSVPSANFLLFDHNMAGLPPFN